MKWWHFIAALPSSPASVSYARLKRVWFDNTRGHVADGEALHEWCNPEHETHLTVTSFEHFALLPAPVWLPDLLETAGLPQVVGMIEQANWSYEWEWWGKLGGRRVKRQCDVVVEYATDAAERGRIVIEAKNLKRPLGTKDKDLDYYLGIPSLEESGRLDLVYLIDCEANPTTTRVTHGRGHVGILDWTALADVQIRAARKLPVDEAIMAYVASSIHRHYVTRGIQPREVPLEYLRDEPSFLDVLTAPKECRQTQQEREERLWRLPASRRPSCVA